MRKILPRLRGGSGVPPGAGSSVLLVTAVFVLLALTAAILGVIGLLQVRTQVTPRPGWLQLANAFLGLFTNQFPDWLRPGQQLPNSFELARLIAPVSTAYVFATSAAVILSERWRLLRARLARDHAVVVGGGRRGVLLSRSLAEQGLKVVMVDLAAAGERAGTSLVRGVIPLSGDPRDVVVLRRAGVERASEVFAVDDDGAVNAAVVLSSRELRAGIERPFACYATVPDSDLHSALEARLLSMPQSHAFRVHLIDVNHILARALTRSPSNARADVAVVLGDGMLARSLTLELIRQAREHGPLQDDSPTSVTVAVVGPTARHIAEAIPSTGDGGAAVTVVAKTCEFGELFTSREVLDVAPPHAEKVVVYVCGVDDDGGLKLGLNVLRLYRDRPVDVVVCVQEGSGFVKAFADGPVRIFDDARGALRIVAASDITGDATSIRESATVERIARALHARYVAHLSTTPGAEHDPGNAQPWGQLRSATRDSNRAQAWEIGEKLRMLGCAILPLSDERGDFTFAPEELERLAEAEHERWIDEKSRQGLTYGSTRTSTTHPDLVPWDELAEEARDRDRMFITEFPTILRKEGYGIVRMPR